MTPLQGSDPSAPGPGSYDPEPYSQVRARLRAGIARKNKMSAHDKRQQEYKPHGMSDSLFGAGGVMRGGINHNLVVAASMVEAPYLAQALVDDAPRTHFNVSPNKRAWGQSNTSKHAFEPSHWMGAPYSRPNSREARPKRQRNANSMRKAATATQNRRHGMPQPLGGKPVTPRQKEWNLVFQLQAQAASMAASQGAEEESGSTLRKEEDEEEEAMGEATLDSTLGFNQSRTLGIGSQGPLELPPLPELEHPNPSDGKAEGPPTPQPPGTPTSLLTSARDGGASASASSAAASTARHEDDSGRGETDNLQTATTDIFLATSAVVTGRRSSRTATARSHADNAGTARRSSRLSQRSRRSTAAASAEALENHTGRSQATEGTESFENADPAAASHRTRRSSQGRSQGRLAMTQRSEAAVPEEPLEPGDPSAADALLLQPQLAEAVPALVKKEMLARKQRKIPRVKDAAGRTAPEVAGEGAYEAQSIPRGLEGKEEGAGNEEEGEREEAMEVEPEVPDPTGAYADQLHSGALGRRLGVEAVHTRRDSEDPQRQELVRALESMGFGPHGWQPKEGEWTARSTRRSSGRLRSQRTTRTTSAGRATTRTARASTATGRTAVTGRPASSASQAGAPLSPTTTATGRRTHRSGKASARPPSATGGSVAPSARSTASHRSNLTGRKGFTTIRQHDRQSAEELSKARDTGNGAAQLVPPLKEYPQFYEAAQSSVNGTATAQAQQASARSFEGDEEGTEGRDSEYDDMSSTLSGHRSVDYEEEDDKEVANLSAIDFEGYTQEDVDNALKLFQKMEEKEKAEIEKSKAR